MPGWPSRPAACASLRKREAAPPGLERDGALDVGVEALVDDAHRALAENLGDAVLAQLRRMLLLVAHALR
jgi:hypothetical protein